MTDLRPYQLSSEARWLQLPSPKRRILGYPTTGGKSAPAVRATAGNAKVVVVAPSSALYPWVAQFETWNGGEQVGIYDKSITRKQLSKKERARLEAALSHRVVLTTPHFAFGDAGIAALYGLPGAALILDEGDMFANPLVDRSLGLRDVVSKNPRLDVLLLTATILTNSVRDLYNPVQTLFPAALPPPRRDKSSGAVLGVPFQFLHRYCLKDPQTGYFTSSARPERLGELRHLLSQYADIVEESEIAAFLPPLQMTGLPGDASTPGTWVADNSKARSVALVGWYRESAGRYYDMLLGDRSRHVELLTGEETAQQRWAKLQSLRESYKAGKRVGVACTAASVLTGLSLAFFERALLTEWRSSPRELLQVLGRFRRVDADKTLPCAADLLFEEEQRVLSDKAKEKMEVFQRLLGKNANAESFLHALKQGAGADLDLVYTSEQIHQMFAAPATETEVDGVEWFSEDSDDD